MKGGNGMKEIWKEAVGNLLTGKSMTQEVAQEKGDAE